VNKKRVLVIDVRTEDEFRGGHLPNALNIPVDSLAQRILEIAGFRNDYVVIYCAAGARSRKASRLLARSSFMRILNMTDGFTQWKSSGFPQVTN
jgi:rhodanese-related sulfurtransferase